MPVSQDVSSHFFPVCNDIKSTTSMPIFSTTFYEKVPLLTVSSLNHSCCSFNTQYLNQRWKILCSFIGIQRLLLRPHSLFLFPKSLILLTHEYLSSSRTSRSFPEKATHRFFSLLLIGMLNHSIYVNYIPVAVIDVNSIFKVFSVCFSRTFEMLSLSFKVPSFGFSADSIAS